MANQPLPSPPASALRPIFRPMFGLVSRPPPPQPQTTSPFGVEDVSLFPSYPPSTHKNPPLSPLTLPPAHLKFTPQPLEHKTMETKHHKADSKDNSNIQIITIAEYSINAGHVVMDGHLIAATKKPEPEGNFNARIKTWGRKLGSDVKAAMKRSSK